MEEEKRMWDEEEETEVQEVKLDVDVRKKEEGRRKKI